MTMYEELEHQFRKFLFENYGDKIEEYVKKQTNYVRYSRGILFTSSFHRWWYLVSTSLPVLETKSSPPFHI